MCAQILKSREATRLPVRVLLEQLRSAAVPETVKPFAVVYVEMGLQRMSDADIADLVPLVFAALDGRFAFAPLFVCDGSRAAAQQWTLVRAVVRVLRLVRPATPDPLPSIGLSPSVASTVLEILLAVLCLHNAGMQPVKGALQAASDTSTAAVSAPPKAAVPPAGLSWAALQRLMGATGACTAFDSREKVIAAKLSVVAFVTLPGLFSDAEIIAHLLVASGAFACATLLAMTRCSRLASRSG